jgi:hypothetical protein
MQVKNIIAISFFMVVMYCLQRTGLCAVAVFRIPSSPEPKLKIVNTVDVYFCCSSAFGHAGYAPQ